MTTSHASSRPRASWHDATSNPGAHRLSPYRERVGASTVTLPHTDRAAREVLSLPTGTAVEPDDIAMICEIIAFALDNGPMITSRLAAAPGT